MQKILKASLTDRQRDVMRMRYLYGWRLQQIAFRMGTSRVAVCKLLQRAHLKCGLPRPRSRVVAVKARVIRTASLSDSFNY